MRVDRLSRRLAGDLETICDVALRKEPESRYPSVEEMARDVRRHLGGRPVSARRASFRYRARKFFGRNRLALAVAAAFAGLIVTALVVLANQVEATSASGIEPSRSQNSCSASSKALTQVRLAAVRLQRANWWSVPRAGLRDGSTNSLKRVLRFSRSWPGLWESRALHPGAASARGVA